MIQAVPSPGAFRRTDGQRQLTRRQAITRALGIGAGLVALDLAEPLVGSTGEPRHVERPAANRVRLGANFNALECDYFDLDPLDTLRDVLSLNLDFLRIGARWDQIEIRPGVMDFGPLEPILELCDRHGKPVILAFGVKSLVWPDFHLPAWARESIPLPPTGLVVRSERLRELGHRFVRRVAERYAGAAGITVFQVENEPFDPHLLTHGWTLDEAFLRRQVAETRAADRRQRPIMLTAFVSSHRLIAGLQRADQRASGQFLMGPIFGRRPNATLIELADIVGFDVYPSIGWDLFGVPTYFRAAQPTDFDPLRRFRDAAVRAGKSVMIAECQAKPWEPGDAAGRKIVSPSFSPAAMSDLLDLVVDFGFDQILLWGVEHWVWHRRYGEPDWWRVGHDRLARRDWLAR